MKRRHFLSSSSALIAGSTAIAASDDSKKVEPLSPSLPALAAGTRLLFQGDSITDMKWGRNEADRNHYLGHSYVFLLAGRLGVDMASTPLEFFNRGISGHTVGDLRKRWQKDAIDMKPDLLSILIGTNDVARGITAKAFEEDYRHILQASHKANPDLKLVLLDPFVLQSGKLTHEKAWIERRTATDAMREVVARLAHDFDAVHVKTQQVFDKALKQAGPEHWIWDGIHPLPQGHELIARTWLKAVSKRWPKA